MFNCSCGKALHIKMEYVGTPVTQEREYYCSCGKVYKCVPKDGVLKEVPSVVEKELK